MGAVTASLPPAALPVVLVVDDVIIDQCSSAAAYLLAVMSGQRYG
jgi:hypothetical protein